MEWVTSLFPDGGRYYSILANDMNNLISTDYCKSYCMRAENSTSYREWGGFSQALRPHYFDETTANVYEAGDNFTLGFLLKTGSLWGGGYDGGTAVKLGPLRVTYEDNHPLKMSISGVCDETFFYPPDGFGMYAYIVVQFSHGGNVVVYANGEKLVEVEATSSMPDDAGITHNLSCYDCGVSEFVYFPSVISEDDVMKIMGHFLFGRIVRFGYFPRFQSFASLSAHQEFELIHTRYCGEHILPDDAISDGCGYIGGNTIRAGDHTPTGSDPALYSFHLRRGSTDAAGRIWGVSFDTDGYIHFKVGTFDFVTTAAETVDTEWHHYSLWLNPSGYSRVFVDGQQLGLAIDTTGNNFGDYARDTTNDPPFDAYLKNLLVCRPKASAPIEHLVIAATNIESAGEELKSTIYGTAYWSGGDNVRYVGIDLVGASIDSELDVSAVPAIYTHEESEAGGELEVAAKATYRIHRDDRIIKVDDIFLECSMYSSWKNIPKSIAEKTLRTASGDIVFQTPLVSQNVTIRTDGTGYLTTEEVEYFREKYTNMEPFRVVFESNDFCDLRIVEGGFNVFPVYEGADIHRGSITCYIL